MFEDFLELLHDIHENISEYMHLHPETPSDDVLEMLQPGSPYFQEHFQDKYQKIDNKYQDMYQKTVNDLPLYKNKESKENLWQTDGPVETIRRVFKKVSEDEYRVLEKQDYKFRKIPYQEFLDQIRNAPPVRESDYAPFDPPQREYNGYPIYEFNYEELRKIGPEQMHEWQELRQEIRRIGDDYDNKYREIKQKLIEELCPEEIKAFPNWKNDPLEYRKLLESIDSESIWEIDQKIYNNPDIKEISKSREELYKKENEIPAPAKIYIEDYQYYDFQRNGIDFREIKYDPQTGEPQKIRIECECDTDIQAPTALIDHLNNGARGISHGSYAKMEIGIHPCQDFSIAASGYAAAQTEPNPAVDNTPRIRPAVV